jgi:hypothetical protein
MTCRDCGLETGSGAGHRSQAECIKALSEEIDRAKRLVSRARDGAVADQDHGHEHPVAGTHESD